MRSNEFTGATLEEAVRKATAVYRKGDLNFEHMRNCRILETELESFKRDASLLLDRAEDLQREADAMADAARREALDAVVGAAVAAAGAFGSAIRALRLLRRMKFADLRRRDWLGLVPIVGGGFIAGASALDAIKDSREADRLAMEARRGIQKAERLGDEIVWIAYEYRRLNCDSSDRTT